MSQALTASSGSARLRPRWSQAGQLFLNRACQPGSARTSHSGAAVSPSLGKPPSLCLPTRGASNVSFQTIELSLSISHLGAADESEFWKTKDWRCLSPKFSLPRELLICPSCSKDISLFTNSKYKAQDKRYLNQDTTTAYVSRRWLS